MVNSYAPMCNAMTYFHNYEYLYLPMSLQSFPETMREEDG